MTVLNELWQFFVINNNERLRISPFPFKVMYEILNWLSQADKSYDPNGHWLYNKFNNKKTNTTAASCEYSVRIDGTNSRFPLWRHS